MRLPGLVTLTIVAALDFALPANRAGAYPDALNAESCHSGTTGQSRCHPLPPSRSSLPSAASTRSFRNCAEARAAGVAPIYRGQPGYAEHLDRDHDGIACEPYRGRR
jgi:hypothetical protein